MSSATNAGRWNAMKEALESTQRERDSLVTDQRRFLESLREVAVHLLQSEQALEQATAGNSSNVKVSAALAYDLSTPEAAESVLRLLQVTAMVLRRVTTAAADTITSSDAEIAHYTSAISALGRGGLAWATSHSLDELQTANAETLSSLLGVVNTVATD